MLGQSSLGVKVHWTFTVAAESARVGPSAVLLLIILGTWHLDRPLLVSQVGFARLPDEVDLVCVFADVVMGRLEEVRQVAQLWMGCEPC